MNYETFPPSPDLAPFVRCYWTLEVSPDESKEKQRIVPDGCIELAFILGDNIKRYTSDSEFIIQPRAMVLGQTVEPFYIQPVGYVHTFAASFYPYGFSSFISDSVIKLNNVETAINQLFEKDEAEQLEESIITALDTRERIDVLESFLRSKLVSKETVENIVRSTVDLIVLNGGNISINKIVGADQSLKRKLERQFLSVVGISPKQLSKLIRLQTALKLIANRRDNLTNIAYASHYYDQSHFIKDFKEFTGVNPRDFLDEESMKLAALLYK